MLTINHMPQLVAFELERRGTADKSRELPGAAMTDQGHYERQYHALEERVAQLQAQNSELQRLIRIYRGL